MNKKPNNHKRTALANLIGIAVAGACLCACGFKEAYYVPSPAKTSSADADAKFDEIMVRQNKAIKNNKAKTTKKRLEEAKLKLATHKSELWLKLENIRADMKEGASEKTDQELKDIWTKNRQAFPTPPDDFLRLRKYTVANVYALEDRNSTIAGQGMIFYLFDLTIMEEMSKRGLLEEIVLDTRIDHVRELVDIIFNVMSKETEEERAKLQVDHMGEELDKIIKRAEEMEKNETERKEKQKEMLAKTKEKMKTEYADKYRQLSDQELQANIDWIVHKELGADPPESVDSLVESGTEKFSTDEVYWIFHLFLAREEQERRKEENRTIHSKEEENQ